MLSIVKQLMSKVYVVSRRGLSPDMEVVYQNLFQRDLRNLGVADDFYPLGWAANYSMMYLICRICDACDIKSVVELGGGQSSLLFDKLLDSGITTAEVTTIEHDREWIKILEPALKHKISHCPLKHINDGFAAYRGYDFREDLPSTIDLLVVDGPPAGTTALSYSRHGALELVDRLDSTGFIVVIDDAERYGEDRLVERFCETFSKRGIVYKQGAAIAAKKQAILASGRLVDAAFF